MTGLCSRLRNAYTCDFCLTGHMKVEELVSALSHLLFCASQASQCFSVPKAWSLVLVLAGTTLYGLSTSSANREVAPEDYWRYKEAAKDDRSSQSI